MPQRVLTTMLLMTLLSLLGFEILVRLVGDADADARVAVAEVAGVAGAVDQVAVDGVEAGVVEEDAFAVVVEGLVADDVDVVAVDDRDGFAVVVPDLVVGHPGALGVVDRDRAGPAALHGVGGVLGHAVVDLLPSMVTSLLMPGVSAPT